jgi:hypothetical protein
VSRSTVPFVDPAKPTSAARATASSRSRRVSTIEAMHDTDAVPSTANGRQSDEAATAGEKVIAIVAQEEKEGLSGATQLEKGATTEGSPVTGSNKEIATDQNEGSSQKEGEPTEEPEDESKYLKGYRLAVLSLGLCLTTFVIALDNTIIATAIPKITTVFNSLDDVGWYGSSYLLTTCSLQPSFGRIYTYFDVKYTYLFALVIFEVGSIICAAATSSSMFIVGRAVAGAGAAALYSGGMTIIGYSVPLRKRPIYIAALSSMFGIASV